MSAMRIFKNRPRLSIKERVEVQFRRARSRFWPRCLDCGFIVRMDSKDVVTFKLGEGEQLDFGLFDSRATEVSMEERHRFHMGFLTLVLVERDPESAIAMHGRRLREMATSLGVEPLSPSTVDAIKLQACPVNDDSQLACSRTGQFLCRYSPQSFSEFASEVVKRRPCLLYHRYNPGYSANEHRELKREAINRKWMMAGMLASATIGAAAAIIAGLFT